MAPARARSDLAVLRRRRAVGYEPWHPSPVLFEPSAAVDLMPRYTGGPVRPYQQRASRAAELRVFFSPAEPVLPVAPRPATLAARVRCVLPPSGLGPPAFVFQPDRRPFDAREQLPDRAGL